MKLSAETYVMRERFDDKTAIKMLKDAGFDCFDYSLYWAEGEKNMLGDDYLSRAEDLRAYADGIGIECNQAHSPFDVRHTDEFDVSNGKYRELVRSLEFAAVMGAKTVIVHAIKDDVPSDTDIFKLNREFYSSLIPYCEKFGIDISVENLFAYKDGVFNPVLAQPSEHIEFVKSLNSDRFNICLDVGHSAITGVLPENAVLGMDKNILKALHIHDNDFKGDRHLMPYFGNFDWDKICGALKEIGYDGELTFEIFGTLRKLPSGALFDALVFARKIGDILIEKIGGLTKG